MSVEEWTPVPPCHLWHVGRMTFDPEVFLSVEERFNIVLYRWEARATARNGLVTIYTVPIL